METHVFDVHGPFALFRKPYAPVSPVSFPFPPPPTVMGMIGAICGYGKKEYLEKVGWDRTKIGVSISKEIRRFRTGINLINTKEGNFYDAVGESQRIQIPHEFLKDVRFRLFVADGPSRMMDDLGERLRTGSTTYTLSLGLSECLAEFEHVRTGGSQRLEAGEHEIDSVVVDDEVGRIVYDSDNEYGHYRIPHRMAPGRRVDQYSVTIAEETGASIVAETDQAYEIGGDRVVFL